jgi:hypothetical protein
MARPSRIRAFIIQNANAYDEGSGAKPTGIGGIGRTARDIQNRPTRSCPTKVGVRHIGDSPNAQHYNPGCWTNECEMLSRPGRRKIQTVLPKDYRTDFATIRCGAADCAIRCHRRRSSKGVN